MKKTMLKILMVMAVFFVGTCAVIALDTICLETTGHGGKFVLTVDNWRLFN